MRFCPNCGENVENVPDAGKCPKCGFDIATHLKELEAKEKERVEKDGFLFTEGRYDFALPDQASGLQADAIMGSITEGTETGTGITASRAASITLAATAFETSALAATALTSSNLFISV
ncbi:MAG: zinc ribbon domain-containing protein [Treponema sp.]|nr:zinc ribbon domain-containing protein [Treponema sp.]